LQLIVQEKEQVMAGLITFLVGATVGAAAIVAWGITRWRTGRGRRW
jgi:DNA-binding transcriptional regulator of glucitol operon